MQYTGWQKSGTEGQVNRMNSLMDQIIMSRGEMMEWINQIVEEYKGTNADEKSGDIGYREGMKDALSGFREYVSREILSIEAGEQNE